MSSATASYLPTLTGVRGLAAAWVFALHAWEYAGGPLLALPALGLDFTPLVRCGYFGVDLFFVLSGFLLAMPFHRAALDQTPRPSLRRFWVHRCRRVLPAYWVQLVILATALVFLQRSGMTAPANLFAHALLIQNLVPWPVTLLNPVYWSMPVEWDFYVFLPLLALIVARCRWPLALGLAVLSAMLFRLACFESVTDSRLAAFIGFGDIQQLPGRIDQFVIGICAAWIVASNALMPRAATACGIAGTIGIVVMAYVAAPRGDFLVQMDVPYLYFHHTLTALSFGLITLGAVGGGRLATRLLANRPLTFLGLVSYSLYLWHYPLLTAVQGAGWLDGSHAPAWVVVVFAAVPAIVFTSWLSYRWIERPFLAASPKAPAPARRDAEAK
jgi:peptidoglycan/LPS O-acetylase OafA/YrhL